MAGRQALAEETWYVEVIDLMIRENLTFSAACIAAGVKFVSAKEEASHQRRQSFQRRYWAMRNAFNSAIGADPSLTKETVMGSLARAIVELEEKGDFDKIGSTAKVLSDIAGWTKEGTQVTVLGSLTQAERDEVRARVKALQVKVPPPDNKKVN